MALNMRGALGSFPPKILTMTTPPPTKRTGRLLFFSSFILYKITPLMISRSNGPRRVLRTLTTMKLLEATRGHEPHSLHCWRLSHVLLEAVKEWRNRFRRKRSLVVCLLERVLRIEKIYLRLNKSNSIKRPSARRYLSPAVHSRTLEQLIQPYALHCLRVLGIW